MRIQNDQKKNEDKGVRVRPILTTRLLFPFYMKFTSCDSYRFDVFLIFNFIQIINKRMSK